MKQNIPSNNNILVTGANGFIGQHLIHALREQGYKVFTIDHEFLHDPVRLFDIVIQTKAQWIFHLAAYGNMASQKDEEEIFQANLIGTWNLLQATKDIPYKAFVNVSTSSVLLPHETMYSATKAGAERLCRAFVDEYKKPIVTVRPFTVIGKGEQKEHLIPTLARSCINGVKMPFNPYPVHDFIDVRDLIEGLIEIAEDIEEYKGQSIGIGTGIQHTNEEVLKIVETLTGMKANIELRDDIKRPYDTNEWHARLHHDYVIKNYSLEETIQWMI